MQRSALVLVTAVLAVSTGVAGCGTTPSTEPTATPSSTTSASPSASPSARPTRTAPLPPSVSTSPSGASAPGTAPPTWLGTRVLPHAEGQPAAPHQTPPELRQRRFTLPDSLPPLPGHGFASRIDRVPKDVLARSTWAPGCPVRSEDLRWVRLTFVGFDGRRHTGELLVNKTAAHPLVQVFSELWQARFPLEEMVITSKAARDAAPTGDGNDTGAFNCRPVTGGTSYSQHASGLAIDLNTFQNPYHKGEVVLPELATSYLDRGWRRPGMILADGPVVAAFRRIGWGWGGDWHSLKDYQHFSENGR